MILSDISIEDALSRGEIVIDPFDRGLLRPCSVCLTLGDGDVASEWPEVITVNDESTYPRARPPREGFDGVTLGPGQFALLSTRERIAVGSKMSGLILGVSGLARLGLSAIGPGLISPGYGNDMPCTLTIEMCNIGPSAIRLQPGMRLCHVVFLELDLESDRSYDRDVGIYSCQTKPMVSSFWKNWSSAAQQCRKPAQRVDDDRSIQQDKSSVRAGARR